MKYKGVLKFLSMTVKEPSGISAQLRKKSRPDFEKWTVIKPRGLTLRLGLKLTDVVIFLGSVYQVYDMLY